MSSKPSIPQGTRDFSSEEVFKREFIFDTIQEVFRLYSYQPIETPAMENLTTLLGKYGEEGDKLVFRILNSGDFIEKYQSSDLKKLEETWNQFLTNILREKFPVEEFINIVDSYQKRNDRISGVIYSYFSTNKKQIIDYCKKNDITDNQSFVKYLKQYRYSHLVKNLKRFILSKAELLKGISEKGLRYDLTVPFARYVVQHRNEIVFPFKRYQIQPVWRADRPQKGRYREFFQCDVDVIGSNSLLNEYELVRIIDEVFRRLKIKSVVKINNRKVLAGIAEIAGVAERITDITVAIDKIEKIGIEAAILELKEKGISDRSISRLQPILNLNGNTITKLEELEKILIGSETGTKGILELRTLFGYISHSNLESLIELDLTLARGLNYYTGAIFEVKSRDVNIGSICGGGRYDDLTGIFGMEGVSGVGVSFGADRIYDVLTSLNQFDTLKAVGESVMIINFGEKELYYNLNILKTVQELGMPSEFYPEPEKMKKQMDYADSKKITYVLLAGEDEMKNNEVTVKNMISGEQKTILTSDLSSFFGLR